MAISFDGDREVRVVVLRGSVLGEEAESLRRRLGEAIAAGLSRVVVDLRTVQRLTSRAIGVLLAHLAELRRRGGDLKLLGCGGAVRELLDLCGVTGFFEFLGGESEIARSFEPECDACLAGAVAGV